MPDMRLSDMMRETEPRPTPTDPAVSPWETISNAAVRTVYDPQNPSGLLRLSNVIRGVENPPQERLDAAMPQGPGKSVGLLKPKRVSGAESTQAGYVYHATNSDRLREIAESGQLKTFGPSYGTDQRAWPDGSTQKRAYFTPTAQNTWQFAPEEGTPVLLRAKSDAASFKKESTSDIYTSKPVPASALEYLADDGSWLPLVRP